VHWGAKSSDDVIEEAAKKQLINGGVMKFWGIPVEAALWWEEVCIMRAAKILILIIGFKKNGDERNLCIFT
jgi:hypothetical protein